MKKQRTIDRSGSDIVTTRGNLCAGIVFSIIDHPAVHTDKPAYRRPDQAGPPEDHDHLHDRRPLQGHGGENDTHKGRERAVLPVAVATASQVSVLVLCCVVRCPSSAHFSTFQLLLSFVERSLEMCLCFYLRTPTGTGNVDNSLICSFRQLVYILLMYSGFTLISTVLLGTYKTLSTRALSK